MKQLHINLPFIEALAQMPKYAKFLKGLLTNKAKLEEACTITMNERCSTVLLNKLPSKEKDLGSFTIPCDIGQLHIDNALADLGASISLMPYTMYEKLGLGEPKPTKMSLELADRVPIILRRPFLATARAMIDVFNKKITLRVGDDEVIFDVDQSIKRPPDEDDDCYGIDALDNTINMEAQGLLANDKSDSFLLKGLEKSINQSDLESCESLGNKSDDASDLEKLIRRIDYKNTSYPVAQETTKPDGVESEPLYSASANKIDEKKPELKSLPHHLEYAYMHGDKSFPIIISSELSKKEKMLLLQVLEKRKGATAWKMSDIKEISPSFCTHKILMEDDFKLVVQMRLNPKVQDVVKNKIVKLLDPD
ncbi:DNA-directed DNA polymerase [Tanacetum coccineum]